MNSAKILVVEDDQLLRDIYLEALKGEGYNVDSATDGEEAFDKIKQGGWDLILLDILLPKLSGIDVIKSIDKGLLPIKNKNVVFLTNLNDDVEIKEALALGTGYLIKSQLTPADLIKEIKIYLSKQ